ncbi:MAG: hypothetical protein ACRD8U_05665 [Pyrinomonadaceae bacterium]
MLRFEYPPAKTGMNATSLKEATALLDYFNGFHDGFIKRLSIVSKDQFINRDEQQCAGALDLEITFAHYNYQNGKPPHDQLVAASFEGVKDLAIEFSGNSYEWAIDILSVAETERSREQGGVESCLKAVLVQKRLSEHREWIRHEDLTFTFRSCAFQER